MKHCIVSFCLLLCLPLAAQRLVPGQIAASLSAFWVPTVTSAGFDAGVDLVRRDMRLPLHVCLTTGSMDYVSGVTGRASRYRIRTNDIVASFGAQWCVFATRSRSLNLWLGTCADMGVRTRSVLEYVDSPDYVPTSGFLWGFSPEVSVEWFAWRTVSLSLCVQPRLRFSTRPSSCSLDQREDWFVPCVGVRTAWYLFTKK